MKLKINKACDLSSISVLPPQTRRSNAVPNGPQVSQHRSQPSQQSFSQGLSSQHGMFSQLSQNSFDEIVAHDQRFGSQERENSVKKVSCLPSISYSREENQMTISRSSTNPVCKWNSASFPNHRCQISEELEHRIGMVETSLSRFGIILDSVQNDIMQINRGTKEVSLDTEGIRQKLTIHDNSLKLMAKGQEDVKSSLDGGLRCISEQLCKDVHKEKFQEILCVVSGLPEKVEASLVKLKNELCNIFMREMQAMARSQKAAGLEDQARVALPSKGAVSHVTSQRKQHSLRNPALPSMVQGQGTIVPKSETGGWNAVKVEQASFTGRVLMKEKNQKGASTIELEAGRAYSVIIESDEDIDEGFSCLLEDEKTDKGNYWFDEVKVETERILKKARKRKRKCCNPIVIN